MTNRPDDQRIVVTGLGAVTCFGADVDEFYQSLLAGKSGVREITEFPVEDFTTRIAAPVGEFSFENYLDRKQARRADPFIVYTMVAGKKALEQAGLSGEALESIDRKKAGILIGSGMGGMDIFRRGIETLVTSENKRRLSPFFIPYILTNMGPGLLAIDLGFMGPNYSVSSACATGNYAIISAAQHIRSGHADLMLCGGVEAPINEPGLAGFCACKALSQRNEDPTSASRPWDRERDGFVMGEGAGVLVLERLTHAKKRGAKILAEYLGGGYSCDAYHMTELRPDGSGVALCMEHALQDAGIAREQVNYINAHATSTPQGDPVELSAIAKVFPNQKITVNATKSLIGHLLGGAGGVEAVVVVKAIETGKVHPTRNLEDPIEEMQFHAPRQAEECEITAALSNSFGFGGHNAAVVFAPFHD